jgi:hypothetical protein
LSYKRISCLTLSAGFVRPYRGVHQPMKKLTLALTIFLAFCALAQQAPPVLRGSWLATAAPKQFFRGRWSAQLLPGTKNAAHGSWTLRNDSNQIVLEGTWSARKSVRGWQGTWSGRIQKGGSFSGTWEADASRFNGNTFEDLLKQTAEKQIAGSWQSRRARGNWWLQR